MALSGAFNSGPNFFPTQTANKMTEQITHPNSAHPSRGLFSPTSLETACPRKYYYEKVLGLVPNREALYLNMGTAIHKFVEEWQILRIQGAKGKELLYEAIENSRAVAEAELKSWPGDPYSFENWLFTVVAYHKNWHRVEEKVIQTESINWIPMGNRTMLGGVMDQIIETPSGGLIVRDTKTTGRSLSDWFWKGMENKLQLSLYFHQAEQLTGKEVVAVEIDAVVISKNPIKDPEKNFHRKQFERSALQQADALLTYDRKTKFYMEGLGLPESERLAHFYCEQSQCSNYGGCPYMPICIHGLKSPIVQTDFTLKEKPANAAE